MSVLMYEGTSVLMFVDMSVLMYLGNVRIVVGGRGITDVHGIRQD